MIVHEPPKGTCVPIDPDAGEWRCRCPPDPHFDTSVNMRCFSRCTKCGTDRPAPGERRTESVDHGYRDHFLRRWWPWRGTDSATDRGEKR